MPVTESTLARIAQVSAQLKHLNALLDAGFTARSLAAKTNRGELLRLRQGWYLPTARWQEWHAEDRQLALIQIVQSEARSAPIFSHYSAAALHGLPLDDRVRAVAHVIAHPGGVGAASSCLKRHRMQLDPAEVTLVGPYLCTTPERTILDLALTAPAPLALSVADAYLRDNFRVERHIDEVSVAEWRDRLRESAAAIAGQRGVRTARWIAAFADARADSPLESVSRYHFDKLGIRVAIQVPVPARYRGNYYLDFDFVGLKIYGECDGKHKYTDPALLGGKTAAERVYQDKRRGEWIEQAIQKRPIHWGWPDVDTTRRFGLQLQAFGVPIPAKGLLLLGQA